MTAPTMLTVADVLTFFRTRVLNCEDDDHVSLEFAEAEVLIDALTSAVRDEYVAEEPDASAEGGNSDYFYVETPDRFAVGRWPRDADIATICRCIVGTLRYEPHAEDITALRKILEDVIEYEISRRGQP
jgi:hypothetical protein